MKEGAGQGLSRLVLRGEPGQGSSFDILVPQGRKNQSSTLHLSVLFSFEKMFSIYFEVTIKTNFIIFRFFLLHLLSPFQLGGCLSGEGCEETSVRFP